MILCTLIGGGQHMIMNKKFLFVFIFILSVILTGVCAFASALPDVRISVGGVTHDNAVVNINVKSDWTIVNKVDTKKENIKEKVKF